MPTRVPVDARTYQSLRGVGMNKCAAAFAITVILCAGLFSPLSAQQGNSVLTGLVEDASKARIPGVEVTATHTQTGANVVVITNEAVCV